MTFRKTLFWVHLVAGIISGLAIGIMCFTGTMLAFEKELVAWSERDARRIESPTPGAPRLTLAQMQARLREAQPEARPISIVLQNDPHAAVAFPTGRTGGFYVNPYTGEVRQPKSDAMSRFMRTMTDWHRYLNLHGEVSRPRGKLINGACNIAFCVLAITGLYLWIPREWSWRALRPVLWFRPTTSGKARDFNWHNVIGLWTAPILIVLTLTAIPISFRWGANLIYTLTGTEAPAAGGPGGGAAPAIEVPTPGAATQPLNSDALFAAAQKQVPDWKTITLRASNANPGAPREESRSSRTSGTDLRASGSAAQAATFTIREASSWPRTATTTLTLNPFNGEVLRRSGYADLNAAQQTRSWTRFLHTGEAVGWIGQLLAGLACLGGIFLVYTGFALSWRRFFAKHPPSASTATTKPDIASVRV